MENNQIECRAIGRAPSVMQDGKIIGYGAVFNEPSEDLGGFVEIVETGFFDDVLDNDVRGLWNHDEKYVLGRTASGTMLISIDSTGLRYEITPPDTQWAKDALESIRRGDVNQSSFRFRISADTWEYRSDGVVVRHLIKCSRLLDVSPVTFAAYPQTIAQVRSMAEQVKSAGRGPAGDGDRARARLALLKKKIEIAEEE